MGEDERNLIASQQTREALISSIYALIDDAQQWPRALELIDKLTVDSNDSDPLSPYPDSITSLLPHLNQAIELLEKLSDIEIKNSHTDGLMNHLPMGLVIIKPDATILSENTRAAVLLEHVRAIHEEKLKFAPAIHQQAFALTCREVLNTREGKSVSMGELQMWVSPHGPEACQLAIFLGHHNYHTHIRLSALNDLYGLTSKEAMVAAELCNGRAKLEEVANTMGIHINTVRSHLKQIYTKTGTNSQAELLKMILTNPSLALQDERNAASPNITERHSQLAHLASGRTLSWAEYGDPKGRPVLLCHAITGGRLIIPQDETMLHKNRLRLIVPDRAGYGMSTPAERIQEQWLEDMCLFIPQIDAAHNLTLLGHSAGGAHAMTLASAYPDIIRHLYLVSSLAPLMHRHDIREILPVNRMLIKLAGSNRTAARGFLKLALKAAVKKPEGYFKLILNSIPDLDRKVITEPRLKQMLLSGFAETARQGVGHMIEEMIHIACAWDVNAADIQCPVTIWHGREDKHAPLPLIQRFSKDFAQTPDTHWVADAGHYLLFYRWNSILKDIANSSPVS